jgi:hypothetical protein
MKRFKFYWFARLLALLVGAISLASLSTVQANPIFNGPANTPNTCMADAYFATGGKGLKDVLGASLNCTANDVEITTVTVKYVDGNGPDGEGNFTCINGDPIVVTADLKVRTNANERWDTTFFLPLNTESPQVIQQDDAACSILIPKNEYSSDPDSGVLVAQDLDGDVCGDIAKGPLVNDEYTLVDATFTMLCDGGDDTQVDFVYCAGWDNQERDNCSEADSYPGQEPNTTSKCNCGDIPLNIFIQPEPPEIVKTLTTSNTHTEPGGIYSYTVSFTNDSASSIFLNTLYDMVDERDVNGTYEYPLDLWNRPLDVVDSTTAEGVYLTASTCTQDPDIGNGAGEIPPSETYSCAFTVHIVDSDLPDLSTSDPIVTSSIQYYDDVVQLSLTDQNGDDVTNGETCPTAIAGTSGVFCSNELTVNVTNLPPDISVVKSADKDSVLEPGANVTFTIDVTNNSDPWDSPVILTNLFDDIYGDLNGVGTCATGLSIAQGATESCSFTKFVGGNAGDSSTNIVEAIARDNEFDTDTATNSHTVLVNDVPSNISLTKTPSVSSVLETGDDPSIFRDVDFTFLFSVNAAGVDDVIFDGLTDTVFGDILADCVVDMLDGAPITPVPLNGYTLSPDQDASCTITQGLQGDDDDQHNNTATITGDDVDGQFVQAMASATVDFDPVSPASDIKFATSMLVVLEMQNAGIKDLTLSSITLKGLNVVDGAVYPEFDILNLAGGDYNLVNYAACNIGEVLGYIGSGTDIYSCAFTIELKPGLENNADIAFSAPLISGIIATFTDNDGLEVSNAVGISVLTDEQ